MSPLSTQYGLFVTYLKVLHAYQDYVPLRIRMQNQAKFVVQQSLKVNDLNIPPMALQVLCHQAPVTMMGLVFAA